MSKERTRTTTPRRKAPVVRNKYPFERIRQLKADCVPPIHLALINLSIGEPQHAAPTYVHKALFDAAETGLGQYPPTKGSVALRESIAAWLQRRFKLTAIDADKQILPVNGTREALFAFAQAVVNRQANTPLVMLPNPFYQIYEGATLLAGAQPYFLNCLAKNDFLPDLSQVSTADWQRCQLIYICSPANPSGTVMPSEQWQTLLELADRYDFIIASDECYSELYVDETMPPVGLLQVCAELGRDDYRRCVVFHSLSKRSNLPGLRSGFVAGDATVLKDFLLYRTYHGCAMSPVVQTASIAAWNDEMHVVANRALYREKFATVVEILQPHLDVKIPPAGFYLFPEIPLDDTVFTREIFVQQHLNVMPGRYLSRSAFGVNPGQNRVRLALVPPLNDCVTAAERIKDFLASI